MNEFRFSDLVAATGATLIEGDPSTVLTGVSTDTRSLKDGQVYVALSGPNFDGNKFATEALSRGAGALLLRSETTRVLDLGNAGSGTPVALHPSPRKALGTFAAWHRDRLTIPVVAITGSCGKTTTKNILLELLQDHLVAVGSPASFNNDIGVPHTLMLADTKAEALIVEMGTNSPGEISELCQIAKPTAGILTNVGASHLEGLGSVEGVAKEKGALVASLPSDGFCVLNADCRFTDSLRKTTKARVITFSVDGDGDLNATDVWFHGGGTTFKLNDRYEITSPLLGLHTVQNLLAALGACVGMGLSLQSVLPAVSRLKTDRRRMERIELGGLTLFDDSYNANPDSALASVRVLTGLHGHARRVLVLGEMLELGDLAAELHHQVGAAAAAAGVDMLMLIGDLTRATAAGAIDAGMPADCVLHMANVESAIEIVPGLLRDGDVVLVKASRAARLERLVSTLREACAEPIGQLQGF
ncbi:MAG: UDP-N-acetylmuramoyl-tripeptide--D-alanyl-D-alanine ligase [Planctomycetota bacterium]|jgi:UDP-N-acetylmuramoyl-tripeptide--D-alanyl-D-alanine ligase